MLRERSQSQKDCIMYDSSLYEMSGIYKSIEIEKKTDGFQGLRIREEIGSAC